MRIEYLKLQNFANIYAAMQKKSIEIDFSNNKNKIILLVGANGSGKTSILSELHPFAYSGSMDVRNNTSLIIKDSKGYKEIHISDGEDYYIIKHHYTRSDKGATVKSFIDKNGEELNGNGNVRSFNAIVEEELDITPDYIKLLRLGSNVSNFIDMKATDRKNFVSDLLSDIDVYNKLFKKVSDDARLLNSSLNIVSGKIKKLDIPDIKVLDSNIESLNKKVKKYEGEKLTKNTMYGVMQGKILAVAEQGEDRLLSEIKEMGSNIVEKNSELQELKDITSDDKTDTSKRNDISKRLDEVALSIANLIGRRSVLLERISDLHNQLDASKKELEDLNVGHKEDDLVSLFKKVDIEVQSMDGKYKNYIPKASVDNMITLLNILMEADNINSEIQTFSSESVRETIKLMHNRVNISSYVRGELLELERLSLDNRNDYHGVMIMYRPPDCPTDKCPYLRVYEDALEISETKTNVPKRRDSLLEMESIANNILSIMSILKTVKSSLPEYCHQFTSMDEILVSIANGKKLYNELKITSIIDELSEYEEYQSLKSKRAKIKEDLIALKSSSSDIETLNNSIIKLESDISTTLDNKRSIDEELEDLEIEKNGLANQLSKIEEKLHIEERIDILISDLKDMAKSLQSKKSLFNNISEFSEKKKELQMDINRIDGELKILNDEILNLSIKAKDHRNLTKELENLQDMYDEIGTLRRALSSTKGMPLYMIQIYFKSSRMYINELLDIVYGGRMQINDFDITDTSFNIPYVNNGVEVDDVIYVSQGEKSFFSIAISFALMMQSMSKYNIPLLDEPDSTLDMRNRALFLDIIERQLDSINAEQMFMITHNDMFDNYPVDLIITSPVNINTKGRNILFRND